MVSTMSGSSSSLDTGSGHRSRDAHSMGSRFRVPEEDSCDSESVASSFEFHKERGASARSAPAAAVPPFSKHPPSKWDDAQKWIASPTNHPSRASNGAFLRKMEKSGFGGGRLPATKVVLEAMEEIDTKRIDLSQEKREIGWQKAVNWATPDPYPEMEPCAKSTLAAESMIVDSADSAGVGVLVLELAVRYPPRLELLHPSTIFTSQTDLLKPKGRIEKKSPYLQELQDQVYPSSSVEAGWLSSCLPSDAAHG